MRSMIFARWIVLLPFCAVCAAVEPESLSPDVVRTALTGPMKSIDEVVFVTRAPYADSHWYANFGYYGDDDKDYCFPGKGEGDIGRLCKLNVRTGQVTVLLDAEGGSIRDPQVHYDAQKILFSYRVAETAQYHLYEINVDGTGLTQLTFGQYDDIEPSYLPDGGIVFVSSRSRQWTGCLPVQVGTIYRYLIKHYSFPHYDDLHEPRPLVPRQREPVLPTLTDPTQATGRMVLLDVYKGRNMEGVKRGEIKKLLVLEALPKPVGLTNAPDLVSFGGTHTLERVLGTVPVEDDGSAHFEVPAKRPVFFVALDENDMSVKRMQSFTTAMPGETVGCVGCHEHRNETPAQPFSGSTPIALKGSPSQIQPFERFPDVLDFPRDIQPILDTHCVGCHNFDDRQGDVVLEGDLGADWSHSYFTLIARLQVADGRHGLGNQPPRTLGSSASPLLAKLSGSHHDMQATLEQWRTVWLWIESAAPYAGSYAALRNAETRERAQRALAIAQDSRQSDGRCVVCHQPESLLEMPYDHWRNTRRLERWKPSVKLLNRPIGPNERVIVPDDPIAKLGTAVLYNFTRPEKSPILLAPLAEAAGGWGSCPGVYKDREDPHYQRQFTGIRQAKALLDVEPRYGAPGFRPNRQYLREMKKYGLLPDDVDDSLENVNVFQLDQRYWRSLWWKGERRVAGDREE